MCDPTSYKYTGRDLALMKKLHKLHFPMFQLDKKDRKNLLAAKREFLQANYLRKTMPYLCHTVAISETTTRDKIRETLKVEVWGKLQYTATVRNYLLYGCRVKNCAQIIDAIDAKDQWLIRIVWINKLLRQNHKTTTSPQIPLITG